MTPFNQTILNDENYRQNWDVGNSFYFRYSSNIFCYAVYKPKTYTINYYDALTNSADNVNLANKPAICISELTL